MGLRGPKPKPHRHATAVMYESGCRCEPCREWKRLAGKRSVRARQAMMIARQLQLINSIEQENRELAAENRLLRAVVFGESLTNDHPHLQEQSQPYKGLPQNTTSPEW